ncbi:multicopper oxidase domain-containing protein, partial [Mycobacterium ulcerans]|nr:multicopper oxidase domain-containing protein [Mycobacterium ulcerans]MEB4331845.1 multicopper oxidase domain-containing protein [Mycobacterium ulcerans]
LRRPHARKRNHLTENAAYTVNQTDPAGLYWYHPHFHTATAHQGWNGLSGAIIVEGDIDAVPEIAAMRERTIVNQRAVDRR